MRSTSGSMSGLTYIIPTRPGKIFKKGNLVDVMDRDHAYCETRKVVKATRGIITTDCGRQWDDRGWWIGENGCWPFPWIRHSRNTQANK